MASITLTSREFNQDASGAKRATRRGPVFITDRGRPAHVLLSIEDYQKLAGEQPGIAKLLVMRGGDAINFEAPRLRDNLRRTVER